MNGATDVTIAFPRLQCTALDNPDSKALEFLKQLHTAVLPLAQTVSRNVRRPLKSIFVIPHME
jgi:hypothetical protein